MHYGLKFSWFISFPAVTTHMDEVIWETQWSNSSFTSGFNPFTISGNHIDPVSRTLGPSDKPNFCLITVVADGFNSLWIKYDPIYDMNPSHFSTDVPHAEALAFSQSVWWKGAQAGTQSPWVFTKGWGEGAWGAAWMDRSNCRAGRSPGEAGREMKEAQMSLCWTSPHSAAFKRREQDAAHVRMSWLLNICLSLCFRTLSISDDGLQAVISHFFSLTGLAYEYLDYLLILKLKCRREKYKIFSEIW